MKPKMAVIIGAVLAGVMLITSQFITIFVVQPLGAVPDGVTLIIARRDKTKFIDSADAVCEREMGGVSLLCRGGVLAGVMRGGDPLLRLPYSPMLYQFTTGGRSYDR